MTEELGRSGLPTGGSAPLFKVKHCGTEFSNDLRVARPHTEFWPQGQREPWASCVCLRASSPWDLSVVAPASDTSANFYWWTQHTGAESQCARPPQRTTTTCQAEGSAGGDGMKGME